MKKYIFMIVLASLMMVACGKNEGQKFISENRGVATGSAVNTEEDTKDDSTGNSNVSWMIYTNDQLKNDPTENEISQDDFFYAALEHLYYLRMERELLDKEILSDPDFNRNISLERLTMSRSDAPVDSIYSMYYALNKGQSDYEVWAYNYMKLKYPDEMNGMTNYTQYMKNKVKSFATSKNSWSKNTLLYQEMKNFLLSFYVKNGYVCYNKINDYDRFTKHYEDFTAYIPKKAEIFGEDNGNYMIYTYKDTYYTIYHDNDGTIKIKKGIYEKSDDYLDTNGKLKSNAELRAEAKMAEKRDANASSSTDTTDAEEEENSNDGEEDTGENTGNKTQALINKFSVSKNDVTDVISASDIDENLLIKNNYKKRSTNNSETCYVKKVKGREHKIVIGG